MCFHPYWCCRFKYSCHIIFLEHSIPSPTLHRQLFLHRTSIYSLLAYYFYIRLLRQIPFSTILLFTPSRQMFFYHEFYPCIFTLFRLLKETLYIALINFVSHLYCCYCFTHSAKSYFNTIPIFLHPPFCIFLSHVYTLSLLIIFTSHSCSRSYCSVILFFSP